MANEKRLIDLDKAFEAINQEVWWTESEKAYFRSFLAKQPKVDAVEVVHSSWILNDDGSGTCKNCHRTTKNCWDYDSWMNYCPNCGAKMDGDGNG